MRGLLDVVIASEDGGPHEFGVVETGLSDHKLVHWTISAARPRSEYATVRRRRWLTFDQEQFIVKLKALALCIVCTPMVSTDSDCN